MARQRPKENHLLFLLAVGLFSWLIPGGGYFLLKEKKRAIIIFTAITLTFCIGLYVGSIGVIDPVGSKFPYAGQIMTSPVVAAIGHHTRGGGYNVYGKPREIGQLYTGLAGMLNLLCIVNAVYLAYLRKTESAGD
ncbi:MAG: DUF6677 family protein [Planctomycetota bacterium]|jgi:hypothetical protein